jgi:AmmeMemoRadiSam system protein A
MDESQRQELLITARTAISRALGADAADYTPKSSFPGDFIGAFVTLRRGKRLRGCMGTFRPSGSLVDTIRAVASSSCKDPRFVQAPVTPEEFQDVRIEISVLRHLERTADARSLRIGTHGVLIRSGDASGCFLPQVAVERGWSVEEFLSQCCSMKCGLPTDAWQKSETEVYFFTTEAFEEEPHADRQPPGRD